MKTINSKSDYNFKPGAARKIKTIFKIDKIQKEEYPFLIAIAAALFFILSGGN